VAYAGIALSADPLVVALMLALQSYTGSIGGVVGVSFRQSIIPDALMGRVSSAFRLYALGAMAVGAFVGGMLARFVGLLAPYWLSALAMVALSFALWPVMNNRTMAAARQAAALGEQDQVESTQSRP
jgi:MFS family permease